MVSEFCIYCFILLNLSIVYFTSFIHSPSSYVLEYLTSYLCGCLSSVFVSCFTLSLISPLISDYLDLYHLSPLSPPVCVIPLLSVVSSSCNVKCSCRFLYVVPVCGYMFWIPLTLDFCLSLFGLCLLFGLPASLA